MKNELALQQQRRWNSNANDSSKVSAGGVLRAEFPNCMFGPQMVSRPTPCCGALGWSWLTGDKPTLDLMGGGCLLIDCHVENSSAERRERCYGRGGDCVGDSPKSADPSMRASGRTHDKLFIREGTLTHLARYPAGSAPLVLLMGDTRVDF